LPRLRFSFAAALAPFIVAGCVATAPDGSGGADAQLRAAVDGPLRRAGVSEACIQSLDIDALTHVRARTLTSPRSSREVLRQRQQLRTFVSRYCPDL